MSEKLREDEKDGIAPEIEMPCMVGRKMSDGNELQHVSTIRTIGGLKLRGKTDDLPQSWWFASTAIPLIAATIGPLANVLSIAALVTQWRVTLPNDGQLPEGADAHGIGIPDPHWEVIINAISLAFGFAGNLFLLLNFTRRIRYIIALPVTIVFWYAATGLLISILVCMQIYAPPVGPGETYSQGFWHAVLAAVLYMIGSMILMINMLGYFLGKYPQHFELDDSQRTLILQTMMFFFWLAGGAGVFQAACGWSYSDALYFCDVTVLTVGFGDFVSPNDVGRGLVFPYSVIGIIFLGLMISSIHKFAVSMSRDKVIKAHERHTRERTLGRTVTNENELRDRLGLPPRRSSEARRRSSVDPRLNDRKISFLGEYGRYELQGRTITFHEKKEHPHQSGRGGAARKIATALTTSQEHPKGATNDDNALARMQTNKSRHRSDRQKKLLLLREEKDRFDAMREIQSNTKRFRQYYALSLSVLAFGVLWCLGALVFMYAEAREQDLSYFEALYFCYVSLLTIGYGDFSPKSNVGKAFFVVWSLIAIPTMTILISDMGDTVVSAVNRGTFVLADWTIMPKKGAWADFLNQHASLKAWLERKTREREEKKRIAQGFSIADPDVEDNGPISSITEEHTPLTLERLAADGSTEHDLARQLALAIKRAAQDLQSSRPRKYTYEEWVQFTRLIRFSAKSQREVEKEEEEEGLVEWDWIGEDSPMLADESEPQWVLDRLCESLNRYTRRQSRVGIEHHRLSELKHPEFEEQPYHASRSPRHYTSQQQRHRDSSQSLPHSPSDEEDSSSQERNVPPLPTDHELRPRKAEEAYQYQGDARDFAKDKSMELTRLHERTESQAVRDWEARIERDRKQGREQELLDKGKGAI